MGLQQEMQDYVKEPDLKQEVSGVNSLYRAVWLHASL